MLVLLFIVANDDISILESHQHLFRGKISLFWSAEKCSKEFAVGSKDQAFLAIFGKNSTRQRLGKFQNSANFFGKTQDLVAKTQGFCHKIQFSGNSSCCDCRKCVQRHLWKETLSFYSPSLMLTRSKRVAPAVLGVFPKILAVLEEKVPVYASDINCFNSNLEK